MIKIKSNITDLIIYLNDVRDFTMLNLRNKIYLPLYFKRRDCIM